jgi:hypothetical protein
MCLADSNWINIFTWEIETGSTPKSSITQKVELTSEEIQDNLNYFMCQTWMLMLWKEKEEEAYDFWDFYKSKKEESIFTNQAH